MLLLRRGAARRTRPGRPDPPGRSVPSHLTDSRGAGPHLVSAMDTSEPTLIRRTADRALEVLERPIEPVEATDILREVIEEIDDALEDYEDTLPIPGPFDPFDPKGNLEVWGDAIDWIEDQLSPIAEPLDRPPVPVPTDDSGWGGFDWLVIFTGLGWLLDQQFSIDVDVDRALLEYDKSNPSRFGEGSLQPLPVETTFAAPAAFAARLGDLTAHGDPVAPGSASPSVAIGGRPALRLCDVHVCTKATPVPHAALGFRSSYERVLINGQPVLRMGDYVDEGPHGFNPIVGGCPSVTVGPTPPPVTVMSPGRLPDGPGPDLLPYSWKKIEFGHLKGTVTFGVDVLGPFVSFKGTVTSTRIHTEDRWTFDVPLGDVDGDGRPEVWRHTIRDKAQYDIGVSEVDVTFRRNKSFRWPKGTPKPNTHTTSTEHDHEVVDKE